MNQVLLKPLLRRVRLMVARAVVRLIDDAKAQQMLQVELLAGETRDTVERFQQYGLSSHPHPGAEGVAVCVGGNRAHTLIINVDDRRYRLTNIAQGEVALYDDLGSKVHLRRGGAIDIVCSSQVTVDAPDTHITGNVQIDGALTVAQTISATDQINSTTGVSSQGIELVTHVHPGDSGGTTGAPQ